MTQVQFRHEHIKVNGSQIVAFVNPHERVFFRPINRWHKLLVHHGWEVHQRGKQRMESLDEAVARLVNARDLMAASQVIAVYEPDTGRAKQVKPHKRGSAVYGVYQNGVFTPDE